MDANCTMTTWCDDKKNCLSTLTWANRIKGFLARRVLELGETKKVTKNTNFSALCTQGMYKKSKMVYESPKTFYTLMMAVEQLAIRR